jgi:hypothetical protein
MKEIFMNIVKCIQLICLALVFPAISIPAAADESRWWPVQAMPKALVRTRSQNEPPALRASCDMMVQSVAGLAAKAVNEGRADEMIWVAVDDNMDVEDWFARLFLRHPQLETRGTFGPWDLVDRYAKQGLIKGYILYRSDTSKGETSAHRPGMDCSVNVATSLAGLLDGIIVDESLEAEAKAHGLTMLLDARDKTQAWCFETYKDRLNRRMVCTQDPRKPNVRDLAIAQKTLVVFGCAEPVPTVMQWLDPLSPILGWNGGDEFKTTDMSSVWGHFQTATDWAVNLPVLMAGTEAASQSKAKDFDPRTIDFNDPRSAVCFVDTDGDNVDWSEGDFFRARNSENYWANPGRGKLPFGWSCCFAHLSQLCPEAIDYAVATQSTNDSFLEWGGGYYYPDRFGLKRSNRWELLARHAQRTWALMRKNNTRIIGFNVAELDSSEARKAYEVFARQADGLLAILVFQYDAYEAGAGRTFWVKDRNGVEIPVISARYAIWHHLNHRPRAGTPAKVAREIRQTVEKTPRGEQPRYDWVIVHAWSWFKKGAGNDENAEDMMPQEDAAANQGGQRLYGPVTWCAGRLPAHIRTVGPEELIWRIRMKHNPDQTKQLIHDWH